jgi:hypothetical protein
MIFAEDFEDFDLSRYRRSEQLLINGNSVLGNFNNDSVEFKFDDLGKHKMVSLSFDLYIHDTWDGHNGGENGPDTWLLMVGNSKKDFETFKTSFSNSECNSSFCLLQSYPEAFPYPNNPKTGMKSAIQGVCRNQNQDDGTSIYSIERTFLHSGNSLFIRMKDELVQTNALYPICDESWSIDNLVITIL